MLPILLLENCVMEYLNGQLHANKCAAADNWKELKQQMKIKGINFSLMNPLIKVKNMKVSGRIKQPLTKFEQ